MRYDIAIIGNDEAAFEVSGMSAADGRRTLAILPDTRHSSWMLSQAVRRLVSGMLVDRSADRRRFFRRSGHPRLLHTLVARAVVAETLDHCKRLESQGVDVMLGETQFTGPRSLTVNRQTIESRQAVSADHIVIGTGVFQTAMHRPTGRTQFCRPSTLFQGVAFPERASILGGNEFSLGLAALISLFGVKTTILAEPDGGSAMTELAIAAGVEFVDHASVPGSPEWRLAPAGHASRIIDCRRSVGFTDHLNLAAVGIEADERGQLWCGRSLETWCSGVYGAGSVIGFASDAATDAVTQAERILHRVSGVGRSGHSNNLRNAVDGVVGATGERYSLSTLPGFADTAMKAAS